ncbi:MAG TPA: cytochrome b/b6 domain-containing protein [Gammaproteobacteria bacterium]|nr:cytochrome b/b6 domain-containing protein [Gammaproteobacteria bacterium]
MSSANPTSEAVSTARSQRVTRHASLDRLGHWLMAASTIVLLGTAFLPILGVEFPWVTIHWTTGVVLSVLVIVHIVRSIFFKPWRAMLIGARDMNDALAVLRFNLRLTPREPPMPGKYTLAQKGIHATFALVVLTAVVTGCLMLAKIDTPFWQRNPYFLSEPSWGVIYLLHGFAALSLITLVMLHVYFSLRPEKRHYLRSMFTGTLSADEFGKNHDPQRWRAGDER